MKKRALEKLSRENGSQISPCIISQVKFALKIKAKQPKNNKKCSREYWNDVVTIIAKKENIKDTNLIKATLK